jgi:catechol 2,3-dioxygenase-like lactoylglutathione lyase family enzyme
VIDHANLSVADYPRSKVFYAAALAPLGYALRAERGAPPDCAGFGADYPAFWIAAGGRHQPALHLAFRAANRAGVDAFYQAAIHAGGRDNGPPGLRPHYHANYYAAFVFDPDGHNIEAVCHAPGQPADQRNF